MSLACKIPEIKIAGSWKSIWAKFWYLQAMLLQPSLSAHFGSLAGRMLDQVQTTDSSSTISVFHNKLQNSPSAQTVFQIGFPLGGVPAPKLFSFCALPDAESHK